MRTIIHLATLPLRLTTLLLPLCIAVAGCSNKPSTSDIAEQLEAIYGCPALEVRDAKKLDGAPGPQGTYDVAFSYTVAIKGDEAAVAKLLSEGAFLAGEFEAAVHAVVSLERQAKAAGTGTGTGTGTDPRVKALSDYATQIKQRRDQQAQSLLCQSVEIGALVVPWATQVRDAIKAGGDKVAFPRGAHLTRSGRMVRSETGWHFLQLAPGFNEFEPILTTPMAPPRFESKVPQLMQTKVPEGGAAERSLTGLIRDGRTDSCLEVSAEGTEKCYGLPSDTASTSRLYADCEGGQRCTVQGLVDERAQSFMSVTRAARPVP